ncbi:MAG: 16S rRNA (uracil(1498)-N(3))-methyltransferase [Cytophagaceae bacterium]
MQLFYIPDIDNKSIVLPEEESRHCVKVLRLEQGELIHLTDGKGWVFQAEIIDPNPKKCGIRVVSEEKVPEVEWHIHIAVAPTKNSDRIEWFVEKVVELGIQEISFIQSERSERKSLNQDRMMKVAVSAMKQSLKFHLPKINPLIKLKEFTDKNPGGELYVAHLLESEEKKHLKDVARPGGKYTVLIGPEGDFSPSEIENLLNKKWKPVTLGNNRLRTETAALAACHILNLINE